MGCGTTSRIAMSGGRPSVGKNRAIENATRAGEPDSAGRLPLRRDVNLAVIGVSLAETAETPRGLPAVAGVSFPTLIGISLAETAETPLQVCGGEIFGLIGASLAGIAEIHSQAPSGVIQ
jgi:hypothetical protein